MYNNNWDHYHRGTEREERGLASERRDFKYDELQHELRHEENHISQRKNYERMHSKNKY